MPLFDTLSEGSPVATEWPSLRVGDLADANVLAVNDGYRVRNEELGPAGIPFVRGGDIGDGWIGTSVVDHIRPELAARVAAKMSRPGDVAFITKGNVGRVGFLRDEQPPVVFAPQVAYWRVLDGTRLDPRWLFYLLRGPQFQANLNAVKTHGSMVADYVSISQQLDFTLTIPPLGEQRAIASVLGALDDKIDLNRRMNETLEETARALFKSWFVDFDPVRAKAEGRQPFGMDAATAALFPDGFEESQLGQVPTGWRIAPLAAVLRQSGGEIQTGPFGSQLHASDYAPSGTPVVMPTNIGSRRISDLSIARVGDAHVERLRTHCLRVGDIVYSRRGDVEKHALVGPTEEGWLCGTGCLRVRPGHDLSPHFLSLWLDLPSSRTWISARAVGATMPNLNTSILGEVPCLGVGRAVESAFERIIAPCDQRVQAARAEAQLLATVRDYLLPKLLSGEVRIRDAEKAVEAVA